MGFALLTKRVSPTAGGEISGTPIASDPGRREGGAGGGTEDDAVCVYRTPMTILDLRVLVNGNTFDGATVVGIRKNGVLTDTKFSVPAGTDGVFSTQVPVSFEDGDLGNIRLDCTASSSGTLSSLDTNNIQMLIYTPDDTRVYASAVGGSGPAASTTKFTGLTQFGDWGTTESDRQSRMPHDGFCELPQIYVETNGRSTDTVLTLRVNGSDTGITITIGAGQTGRFEESSPTTAAFSAGDLISWGITWGSGTGAFESSQVGVWVVSDDELQFPIFIAGGLTGLQAFSAGASDAYACFGGMFNNFTGTTENEGVDPLLRLSISDLYALVVANTLTDDTVLSLQRDGSPTAQTATFGSGETGWQSDGGAAVDFYPGDELNLLLEIGATGTSISFAQAVALATLVHEVTVTPSANIAASGENTTAQLTAPAGKTTGDFGGGRIQDDENPGDTVDLAADEYREDEWALKVLSGVEVGASYEFRLVLADGTVFDTYTEVPKLTIVELPSQVLRPVSDLSVDGWEDELGGTTDIFQSIDEASPDDGDYVVSP